MTEDEALQRVAEYCRRMGRKPPVKPYAVFAREGETVTLGYDMWVVFPDGRMKNPPSGIDSNPSYYYVKCETGEVGYYGG